MRLEETEQTYMEMTSLESQPRRLLVVDRKGTLWSDVAGAVACLDPQPELLRLRRSTELAEAVAESRPDVLIAGPGEVSAAGMRRLSQVHRTDPRLVILVSSNGKPVSVGDAAACGASDVLACPSSPKKIRAKIAKALDLADQLRFDRVVEHPVHVPEAAPSASAAPQSTLGKVFTVASASGGCGKTFFATNFTAYLARATGAKVLLVDLDLQFGEVATTLQLRPERTIADLAGEEDPATVLGQFVVDQASGYQVLCAPKDPMAAERIGPREATAVIEAARSLYDYVIVDTPPSLNEVVLAAMDQSQALVVMATMDLPSLRNLRVFLRTLDQLNLPSEQVSILLNKAESGNGIELREVEELFPQGFVGVLPYAKEVSWSINAGSPVVESRPDSNISQLLISSAMKLAPPASEIAHLWQAPPPKKRRRWSLFRKGVRN